MLRHFSLKAPKIPASKWLAHQNALAVGHIAFFQQGLNNHSPSPVPAGDGFNMFEEAEILLYVIFLFFP